MKITLTQEGKKSVAGGIGLLIENAEQLHAELLANPSFEEEGGWETLTAAVERKFKSDRPLFVKEPRYLRLRTVEPRTGVRNTRAVFLQKGQKYAVSLFVRSYEYRGAATVGLYKNGTPVVEKKFKLKPDGKWHRYAFKFKAKGDYADLQFSFTLINAGAVHIDGFSLLPENAIKGVFRRELAELLREMKPAFVRFPVLAENWKSSLGRWSGIGIYELFLLCEYLGAKPFPVLEGDFSGEGAEALDFLDFVLGDEDSEWGSARAEEGSAHFFALEYIGLSPENATLADAIGEKYPQLRVETVAAYTEPAETDALAEAASLIDAEQSAAAVWRTGAPLLNGERGLVHCSESDVEPTDRFLVQYLFSLCTGNTVIGTETDGENVVASATEREGFTFVKVVNNSDEAVEAELEGDYDFGALTRIIRLEGNRLCEVAPSAPRALTLPPRSFQVSVLRR